ncbi:MAG: hypothetical protein WC326_09965 [Candidatus Delongbacteria bacterium]
MAIPFVPLMMAALGMLSAAGDLKKAWSKPPADSPIEKRVSVIEEREAQQAQLIENMALQINSLTSALHVLSTYTKIAFALAAVSFLSAIVTLFLVLK